MRLIIFLLFPALELYLLVKVGGIIGALNMVLWVFVSAAIGLWATRMQGQHAMQKVRAELAEGRVPQNSFMDGVLLFFGGVLLILPGLITDAVGLLLLIPPFRRLAAVTVGRYLTTQQAKGQASRVFIFRGGPFGGSGPQGGYDIHRARGGFGDAGPRDGHDAYGRQNEHDAYGRQDGQNGFSRRNEQNVRGGSDGFGQRHEPGTFDAEAQEPRQATVLDSRTIDVDASSEENGKPSGGASSEPRKE